MDNAKVLFKEIHMAKVTVSGLKGSTGMKGFEPLDSGRYRLRVVKVSIGAPKNNSPSDVWKFEMQVIDGPEQKDGSDVTKKKYFENCVIMQEAHPSFEQWGHIGVDQLKSMCLAFGVAPRGDEIDPDAFVGQEAEADIVQKLETDASTGQDRKRNNVNKWLAIGEAPAEHKPAKKAASKKGK